MGMWGLKHRTNIFRFHVEEGAPVERETTKIRMGGLLSTENEIPALRELWPHPVLFIAGVFEVLCAS